MIDKFPGSDNIIIALLIAVIGFIIINKIKKMLRAFLQKKARNSIVEVLLLNVVYSILLIILAIIVLNKINVPTNSLLTILGVSGLALALALQGSLSNIASGILLAFEKPFKIGDLIEFGGATGYVEEISLFNTLIRGFNYEGIYIPNSKLTSDKVINKTYRNIRRLDLEILISYNADIKKAKQIIVDLVLQDKRSQEHHKLVVAVKRLDATAVVLAVRPWVKPDDYSKFTYDLLENIKHEFDQQGITQLYQQKQKLFVNLNSD